MEEGTTLGSNREESATLVGTQEQGAMLGSAWEESAVQGSAGGRTPRLAAHADVEVETATT